ncbi:DNA-directed RNA polymerase [Candidatus Woesearchaeota archaeon]|nr:DNA-directed RNA polymerase [Candidatus Woesearchaeota archaeon]
MFYKVKVKDHVRVPPNLFGEKLPDAVLKMIKKHYNGYISQELGIVIDVAKVDEIKEGVIIPGDGAAFYESVFELLTFKPEMQEVISGTIKDIADFGAFINIGPIDGMIHISQTMDDFVSFSKDKALLGKESRHTLKVGDKVNARIIAVSFKDPTNPKIGMTMRQQGLGKPEWSIEEDEGKGKKKAEA